MLITEKKPNVMNNKILLVTKNKKTKNNKNFQKSQYKKVT